MHRRFFLQLVFVVYCVEAATILIFTPWLPLWDRCWMHLAWSPLSDFFLDAIGRSLVTSFGLIHLIWAIHDTRLWFSRSS